ncbi:hypothetical protein FRC19_007893 [Serendipita sp. 401]|nr:hypothetical protein FRC19_007893 [Serendipita sp. 401]
MLSLVHLPPELILEIIQGYLNISDSFHLIQACKHLYKHVQSKAFWLYIVKCVQSWRPIPNSTSWSILPVEPLRDLAIDAIKLTTLFESPTLRGLREVYSLPVKRSAVSDGIMDQGDSLMYSWLTRDGIHSVSVSIRGKLTLWHLPSRYLLVSVDIGGPMQCWDEEVDTEGITIIVNAQTRAPGGASSTFYAYRYDFMTKECNLVVTQTIHGGLECNYIQGCQQSTFHLLCL